MTRIDTPDDIIRILVELRELSEQGVGILRDAEAKAVTLDSEADKLESRVFMEAQGTVADRTHIARLKSIDARKEAELAKAEVNYIKTKLRHLSEQVSATQTASKMIEIQWKTAGIR